MIKKLYFENSQGKVEMFLGGAGPIRVTALSGLGNPEKKYNTVTFAGKDGQKTLSSTALPRNIIIRGDIRLGSSDTVGNMLKVLHDPGTLVLDFGSKKRMIYCSQVDFTDVSRSGSYMDFVLTLCADGVYFTDTEQTEIAVFEREDLLKGDIVFPKVFTKKTTEADVENFGEVNVEPVITIYNLIHQQEGADGEILIENKTNGQKIKLNTGTLENEVITIDIANREIKSNLRSLLTHLISDDTYLNKFFLSPGKNLISANHTNDGEQISVTCSYYSNYREAIW